MGRTFNETRVEAAFDSAMRQAEHYMDDDPDPLAAA